MQRRGTVRFGTLLAAIVISLSVILLDVAVPDDLASASASASVSVSPLATPADDGPVRPPGTITEFYPERANLSDCVGLVEKPGCGSGSRGGWHQTAVFLALFAGLGAVLWRVARGIKANRAAIDRAVQHDIDSV